ncbi:homoserine kinase [Ferrimonas senticii]|uniref:homoserine kinase n=1 Tax=Ferrimonas senticii TaxID=394566 RepID=UPI00041D69F0|nr:homoserine kinase [Ferrimonas senticii]
MRAVTAYAPASMGNLSVGFDLLGAALAPVNDARPFGDLVTVALLAEGCEVGDSGIVLTCSGRYAEFLPTEGNIVERCAEVFIERHVPDFLQRHHGLALHLQKNLPIGSGLGSSASSVVAALAALNRFFGEPLDPEALLLLTGELEGAISGSIHYDNVAPSLLGGMQLMQADRALTLPQFENWYWLVAYPGITLSTAKMRALLPAQYDRATTIEFGQNLAGFIAASYRGDEDSALALLKDVLAEPHRAAHIPGFVAAKAQLSELGFEAVGISGSGPTLFAVCRDGALAEQGAQYLQQHYLTNEFGMVRVCRIAADGVSYSEPQSLQSQSNPLQSDQAEPAQSQEQQDAIN